MKNNRELQLAEDYVCETNRHVFLTGKAGTGKTTFLKKIRQQCAKRMAVTAPTGIAALNAGGVTLHSFFQLSFAPFIPGNEGTVQPNSFRINKEKKQLIRSLDLLIIDEISMVRADMLDAVDYTLQRVRRNGKPFGGVQMLMIGDLQQLSPVVTGRDKPILDRFYETPYFFSSKVLQQIELVGIELQQVYRQSDSTFISLLNSVREGTETASVVEQLNQRFQQDLQINEQTGAIVLCTHNQQADQCNDSCLENLGGSSRIFQAEIEGDFPEKIYPTAAGLELKTGAQVMFLRNDPTLEKRYYNGTIGTVVRMTDECITIECQDGDPISVEPVTWENITYTLNPEKQEVEEKVIGTFTQFPLRLAWAITIHKSQGLTFDRVIIDAEAAFSHGQVYVALSRCRTLEGIMLSSRLSGRAMGVDPSVASFTKRQQQALDDFLEQLPGERQRYQRGILQDCYDFRRMEQRLGALCSQLRRYQSQIQLFGAVSFEELQAQLQDKVHNEITLVGQNFCRQLEGLFQKEVLPSDDPVIAGRLQKAAGYFGEKLRLLLIDPFTTLRIESDNKEISKQLEKSQRALLEAVAVKTAVIAACGKGYSPNAVLRAETAAQLAQEAAATSKPKKQDVQYTEADIAHPELFTKLKQWRKEKADKLNVAPFQILHQKVLVQMTIHLPDSGKALLKIKGVGQKILENHGEELLAMIAEYRREHNIEEVVLPLPEIKQSTENSPALNTGEITFAMFQQGKSVAEVAKTRDLTTGTITKHILPYIANGKIAINALISAEREQTIRAAFQKIGSESLKPVKESLGEEFTYAELHMVRAAIQAEQKTQEEE